MFNYGKLRNFLSMVTSPTVFTMVKHLVHLWPRGLRRRSAVAWLLGSRIRIPIEAWMSVVSICCVVLCR
jgi:hypothetical protein